VTRSSKNSRRLNKQLKRRSNGVVDVSRKRLTRRSSEPPPAMHPRFSSLECFCCRPRALPAAVAHLLSLIRDVLAFTDYRIISVDKQGLTGKRQNLTSIPYRSISMFTRVSAGHLDWNAELHVWVRGRAAPYPFQFYKGVDINQVYRLLSYYVIASK
jgi:Bacterial PH domain